MLALARKFLWCTTTESRKGAKAPRPQVAAASTRASIAMRERDGEDVPQWLREVAAGKALPLPAFPNFRRVSCLLRGPNVTASRQGRLPESSNGRC